jgi:hypothetical protein
MLVTSGRLTIVSLTDLQYETFLNLTGALPPDDIGDGEAATIACAEGAGAAVIDERKAIRIAMKDFPNIKLYSSLDLLCASCVFTALGKDAVTNAVRDAIIPPPFGVSLARLCEPFPAEKITFSHHP